MLLDAKNVWESIAYLNEKVFPFFCLYFSPSLETELNSKESFFNGISIFIYFSYPFLNPINNPFVLTNKKKILNYTIIYSYINLYLLLFHKNYVLIQFDDFNSQEKNFSFSILASLNIRSLWFSHSFRIFFHTPY